MVPCVKSGSRRQVLGRFHTSDARLPRQRHARHSVRRPLRSARRWLPVRRAAVADSNRGLFARARAVARRSRLGFVSFVSPASFVWGFFSFRSRSSRLPSAKTGTRRAPGRGGGGGGGRRAPGETGRRRRRRRTARAAAARLVSAAASREHRASRERCASRARLATCARRV